MEEAFIKSIAERDRMPFRVPEGYFDTLASRVMEQIPEEEVKTVSISRRKHTVLRPVYIAAACLVAALFSTVLIFNRSEQPAPQDNVMAETIMPGDMSESDFDQAADYAMLDNHDIYTCLMND